MKRFLIRMLMAVMPVGAQGVRASETVMYTDTIRTPGTEPSGKNPYRFSPAQLVVPASLLAVGFAGLESGWLKKRNHEIRDGLQKHPHDPFRADDYTQYAPLAAMYALKLCGVRSMHGYAGMTVITGTACLLTGITTYGLKTLTGVERPDGSARNAFPSGHTATAFMGAELLRREYWETSPWIGVAGYAVAAGTGFLRMYNNRHWLTDVIAGAGLGILAAEAAYWLYPLMARTFFHRLYMTDVWLSPYASQSSKGIVCTFTF